MLKRNVDNNILKCPFCSRPIDAPREIRTGLGGTFSGGKCECGSVYVYDRSGHNLGEAYVDALTFACDDDWDKAWSLVPDEDYKIQELRLGARVSYDSRRDRVSGIQKRSAPTFLFVLVDKP